MGNSLKEGGRKRRYALFSVFFVFRVFLISLLYTTRLPKKLHIREFSMAGRISGWAGKQRKFLGFLRVQSLDRISHHL